ncbi:MAG: BREX-1 system adenine-specific DNA-methyltransferase PglX [Desulfovibrio sp.]|jgi:type II restriction/modification system DNA methylase subunit YeeA|nr:BREX-1 system adenine-specific DNA-methyltransferase PglX [Desulfovibrio sp.]
MKTFRSGKSPAWPLLRPEEFKQVETARLKRFAQFARRSLLEQVSVKLKQALAENSAARRERAEAVKKLEEAINGHGKEQVIKRVAYIWFNRFCALRFMDVNRYNRVNIISPADPGQFQPEILAEAKMGHIDEDMVHDKVRQQIFALLDGKAPSRDPQGEAYRLLVVAACNFWNKVMPFLFQRIADYTELLIPDDLLSGNSILAYIREAMTPDICEDVEVIGWLYQFYISEKKDAVFEGLKKNKKVTPENIPAATQLFTPHWIVRYLVENSLGRLWMLNRPKSGLTAKMAYYIKPEQPEADFLRVKSPEEIKICDPACGSGHMLTYAFDLLYAIYEEEGYAPSEIPEKILRHNLYGLEIDERAGALAAFALSMKARARQRGFFRKPVQPNICVLQNVKFEDGELTRYMDFIGRDLFTTPLVATLRQFEEADNFGSLIRPEITDCAGMRNILEKKDVGRNMLLQATHEKVLRVLKQSEYLSQRYHVVIANPPYMGGKGMNGRLGAWAKDNYPNSKSDLFAMFIERGLEMVPKFGYHAMVTMQSWMFLSSYETLRSRLMDQTAIECMVHMANMVMGIAFGTAATVLKVGGKADSRGAYCYVEYSDIDDNNRPFQFPPHNDRNQAASEKSWFFRASVADFKKIPGSPIAYWVSEQIRNAFVVGKQFGDIVSPRQGLATGFNDLFLRGWHEVSVNSIGFNLSSRDEAKKTKLRWFPYNKGGDWRKWFGNAEYIVDWFGDGERIRNFVDKNGKVRSRPQNTNFYFQVGITWADITTKSFAARYSPAGFIFDVKGSSGFPDVKNLYACMALMNSKLMHEFMSILNPTSTFQVGDMARIPYLVVEDKHEDVTVSAKKLIDLGTSDWDAYETSWSFSTLPLLSPDYRQPTLAATYVALRAHWRDMTLKMQRLEEENNRIFIDAYGLQDELTPDVPLKEITLTCNPHYRYGGNKTEEELEALLLADTMKEFISYAVGCMFGRYALEKPGLVLANQGETFADYYAQIPHASFPADDDNVIPILDGDWFTDDITGRFREFLRVTFGDEHYEENLAFIEKAIDKDIRKYFTKDFYTDHIKRYKKRPIYWLFSSPKGSFNALIYMHRYTPDTVSIVMNDYLREFQTKLATEKALQETIEASTSSSPAGKAKATKELDKIRETIRELEEYERDTLYPLATRQIEIDLDDGVKANYPKFGAALKKIPGLDAKKER